MQCWCVLILVWVFVEGLERHSWAHADAKRRWGDGSDATIGQAGVGERR